MEYLVSDRCPCHSLWHFAKPDGVLSIAERPTAPSPCREPMVDGRLEQGRKLFDADIRVRHPIGTNDAIDKLRL